MAEELHPHPRTGRSARSSLEVGSLHGVCRADLCGELRAIYGSGMWAFDSFLAQEGARILRGRRLLVAATLNGVPVLVKRLFHGGALRGITRDRFLTTARLRNHLAAADFLASRGVATPEVLFASWRRLCGTIRGEIGVRYIPDAVDASAHLLSHPRTLPDDWRQRISKVGEMVARLHRLKVLHGDLNLRNFLFLSNEEVSILDLDKARLRQRKLSSLQRRRNLARLERSLRKQGREAPPANISALIEALRSSYHAAHA